MNDKIRQKIGQREFWKPFADDSAKLSLLIWISNFYANSKEFL